MRKKKDVVMVPWRARVNPCRTARQSCTTARFAVEDNERVVQHYALIIANARSKRKLEEREAKARLSQHTSVEMTWFSKDTSGSRWGRTSRIQSFAPGAFRYVPLTVLPLFSYASESWCVSGSERVPSEFE